MFKYCEFCNKEYNRKFSIFCSNSCKNKKYYSLNKELIAKKYTKNKDSILEYKKSYYKDNKQNVLSRTKKWRISNIDLIREYHGNRVLSDIERVKASLRSRLNRALKGNYKSGSAIFDLGCSIDQFKVYLESKFQPGMTWGNYGLKGWHIDHIKPLDSFNLSSKEELKIACHHTNLQPLWAADNLKKGAKYAI